MRGIWAHEQGLYARTEVLQLYDSIFTSLLLWLTILGGEVGHPSRDCPSEPKSGTSHRPFTDSEAQHRLIQTRIPLTP